MLSLRERKKCRKFRQKNPFLVNCRLQARIHYSTLCRPLTSGKKPLLLYFFFSYTTEFSNLFLSDYMMVFVAIASIYNFYLFIFPSSTLTKMIHQHENALFFRKNVTKVHNLQYVLFKYKKSLCKDGLCYTNHHVIASTSIILYFMYNVVQKMCCFQLGPRRQTKQA